ncbi:MULTISPECIES: hybrid sensor histidine kinase/response regulator [unclassified Corallococcus]|uniref:hybrid sensor histidine kinase/response regulator n=1 Tax=unclassified Corallococcus TaxID=2685029 RepID=UPI001A8F2A29|nr:MULTISPECIES: ATP-binding protein [unclassified Corallococcus]MBN9684190.1 response regulator [Corallococcus sp. NCSPR001]WAS84321.1 ATP-binding protein [Corallococcus sp. NCRR]
MSQDVPPQTPETLFTGGSQMHALVRTHDWAASPVGPVASWPTSLKMLVKTLLGSRYPMILTWGPRLTQFYNDAYSLVIGDKHPAALGTDIRDTLAEAWDSLEPLVREAMTTGVASWVPALRLLLNRSGYREESYFDVSHAPAYDDTGAIGGMLAVCAEVTPQVLSERRTRLLRDLSAQAADTRSVTKTCGDVVTALADHPLDVPCALLYLREADGRSLTLYGAVGIERGGPLCPESVPLDASSRMAAPFLRALAGERVLRDGLEALLSLKGGPFGDAVGTLLLQPLAGSSTAAPLGVLVTALSPNRAFDEGHASFSELLSAQVAASLRNARAYEEERQRAEALAELDRAKTAFFHNISHEFRTPLTLMLGPLEDVLAQVPVTEGARKDLELVHRNAGRLLRLVNTLLDFSRLEAGRIDSSFEPTDLAAFTRDLTGHFRSAIERTGLSFSVACAELPEPVWVDRQMWEKVVFNLLSNALKFTFEGGIIVRQEHRGHDVLLRVTDTGTGIPQEELPRLFERFHRVRNARSRTHEGTGIGLALVRELVALHGGDVSVESGEGRGTTFTVRLPRGHAHLPADRIQAARQQDSTALGARPFLQEAERWSEAEPVRRALEPVPAPRDEEAPGVEAPRARVLVVDDNADMREYVERVLSPSFDVTLATDGQAALAAARASPPDLVLTDVMMPRLGGFGLLRGLRERPSTRAVPVVMLSARAGEEAAVEGLEAGADDYLVKPFSARELVARVRSMLELSRTRREVLRQELLSQSLRESVQARDDFLAVASHELKTPLAAFRLHLERLERSLGEDALGRAKSPLESAGRQVRRLHALMETLLDVSQLTTGRLALDLNDVDLSAVVGNAVARLREEMARTGVTVTLDAGAPLVGRYDRLRIDQVVTHLLTNAAKYGQGRPIAVRVAAGEGTARLIVRDEGIGISEADRARIFERFERAVPGRNYGGLGLGLWIARQVVEAHGGRISVDSQPGAGSTFVVELPLEGLEAA